MRVFVWEFITGGGLLDEGSHEPFPDSLLREGSAMIRALAEDFRAIEGTRVSAIVDHRLEYSFLAECATTRVMTAQETIDEAAKHTAAADWTIVIAPEFSGHLLCWRRFVEAHRGRVLGPGTDVIELCGDKQATVEHLTAAGVPVSQGRLLRAGDAWPTDVECPAVLKPRYGAGSQGIRLFHDCPTDVAAGVVEDLRLERYCPGLAVSATFLGGPAGIVSLPPCVQRLSDDGSFRYLGGATPLEPALARRATVLARRAVESLPPFLGYLGVDLVLGDDPAGTGDVVIEINPRMTTSYVGLRAATTSNLAKAMLLVATAKSPRLSFHDGLIEFDADGTVRMEPARC